MNEGDKNAKKMLSNYNAQGDGDYQGCGPKAAQNVLRYFGIEMKQKDIRQYVHTHKVNVKGLDDGRFTTPVELEDGLRAILKKNGIKDIEVVRVSGKSAADIQGMLDNGFPVICLVDKGHHWVSIAGIRSSYFGADKRNQQFYVMNNWNMEVRNWSEMGLQFDDAAEAAMNALKVFAGGTSYKPGTLIYFKRKS